MSTTEELDNLYAQLQLAETALAENHLEKEKTVQQQQEILAKIYDQLYDSLYFYLLKPYTLPSATSADGLLLREFKLIADKLELAARGTEYMNDVWLYFLSEDTGDVEVQQYSKRLQLLQIMADFANVYRQDRDITELDSITSPATATGTSIVERLLAWRDELVYGILNPLPGTGNNTYTATAYENREILQKLVDRITLRDPEVNPYFYQLLDAYNNLKETLLAVEDAINLREQEVTTLTDRISALLFGNFTSDLPVLLFPLRIETKFVEEPGSNYPYDLLVRVFPDDVAIQAHAEEMQLTAEEIADGAAFWQDATLDANGIRDFLPGWRQLVTKYESPRAAWIARTTNPATAGTLLPKADKWAQAAYSYVLPEHFVVYLYETYPGQSQPTLRKSGNTISHPLQVGINPSGITEGDDDDLDDPHLDPQMKWLTDFDKAEEIGMGIRIGLTLDQYNRGFDRLVVTGMKLGQADGSQLLQNLMDHHHFGSGLKILPQGTATNNTSGQSTGYSEQEWLNVDKTFAIEMGLPLYTPTSIETEKADGQRLAEALGIAPDTFVHVANADGRDIQEAIHMNRCLWHATLGYYFEEMLRPTFSLAELDELRGHFTRNVQGRGPLPAFSVGEQPYGVVVTSAFSDWTETTPFKSGMKQVLDALTTQWKGAAGVSPTEDNALDTLVKNLGLEASSSEFYQRYGFGPILSRSYLNTSLQGALGTPTALYQKLKDQVGLHFEQIPKIMESSFQENYRKLAETGADTSFTDAYAYGDLIDNEPFSESRPLAPFPGLEVNYISWLGSSDFHQVREEKFSLLYPDGQLPSTFEKPNTLLYHLLRHALLLCYWDVTMRILGRTGAVDLGERAETELFAVVDGNADNPRWAILDAMVDGIPAWAYLQQNVFLESGLYYDDMTPLRDMLLSLPRLAVLPTARLERLFVEHLDVCAYRLDAWKTGQVYSRLKEMRAAKPTGLYVGAYGWLEGVGRTGQDVTTYSETPQSDAGNQGYIHAPSLNHATAAAILRQGYQKQQEARSGDFAVDLTSNRVRQALDILEGIREGQNMNALLGYRFERGLHDKQLDQYIYMFRDRFPLVASNTDTSEPENTSLQETLGARNVVDGLKLLDQYKSTGTIEDYITGMNILEPDVVKALAGEFINLAQTVDALSDLMVAEGIYQTALGKFDYASASLDSLANGKLPPMPEIVQSPRREYPLTQRVLLNLPLEDALLTNATGTPPWWAAAAYTSIATPMAQAEPKLNAWMRDMLRCLEDASLSATVTVAGTVVTEMVTLPDLGLQPVDWVYLFHEDVVPTEGTFLHAFVKQYLIKMRGINPEAGVTVNLEYAGQELSLPEIQPLLSRLHKLLGYSRASNAMDMQLDAFDTDHPEGYDMTEWKNRIAAAHNNLLTLVMDLAILADGTVEQLQDEAIREVLLRVGLFNMPEAATAMGLSGMELAAAAGAIASQVGKRLQRAQDILNEPDLDFERSLEAVEIIFGKGFRMIPRFNLTVDNEDLLEVALAHSDNMLPADRPKGLVMDEWLQGVARVKERVELVEKVAVLHDVLNSSRVGYKELELSPVQLPLQWDVAGAYADKWVGIELPEGYIPNADKLSVVLLQAGQLAPSTWKAGLLIDEWVETIPQEEVTTAVAFHYDQPQSQPPQTLLLAVPPVTNAQTSWNINWLIGCINETLDMAKLRAVEPDQLATGTALAQLLPALVAPVSATNATIALDFAKSIKAPYFEEQPLL